jgi:HSP20 family molecular chaperone IbpA
MKKRSAEPGRQLALLPDMDVTHVNGRIIVWAVLPGVPPDDINVSRDDGSITISGHNRDTEADYHGTVDLPADVDPDAIETRFEDGRFEVVLHRRTA